MKCIGCAYYKPDESICIKMKEGRLNSMEGDCLMRYMINMVGDVIDILEDREEDGDEWKV